MVRKNGKLAATACFLFDMDGTIYLGEQLLPGAEEMLGLLDENGVPYYFLTNNSSKSRADYVKKLAGFGLTSTEENIFTSGEATAIYLKKQKLGARLYVVGTPSLENEFASHGFELTENDPDLVVLGFDTTLTYEKLWKLCDFVREGRRYIATHPDINCPTEGGFMPDIGAMMALVAASTGREPDMIVGKPNPPMVEAVMEKTGFPADQLTMVGDRLYTDMAMGQAGMTTALVLTGETRREDAAEAPHTPDYIIEDLAELVQVYRVEKGWGG